MLTPEQLTEIVDTMYPLLDRLNNWITKDLIERMIACMERGEKLGFGETDKWRISVYQAAAGHYAALTKEISDWLEISDDEVRQIFQDAGLKAWNADDAFFTSQGLPSVKLLKSESLMGILTDAYERTNGEIHNFTRTIADSSEARFIKVCDDAHMKVMSGVQSYTEAVKEAVNELSAKQTSVRYPSGHEDTIETAVLRCVRTGTAQASGNMTVRAMKDNGWDLIRVSAHLGARYGDGGHNPGNHFWWQGKLYSLSGNSKEYPSFIETTGYGTGEGLSGWNCRHSFGPGDPNHNPFENFDAETNKKAYDLSQKQRKMERAIRSRKRKLLATKTAIDAAESDELKQQLQYDYDENSKILRLQNKEYNSFCEENGLKRYSDRLSIAMWNRQTAAASAQTALKIERFNNAILSAGQTQNGREIRDVSTHVFTRANYRNLSSDDIVDSLTNPLRIGNIRADGTQQFVGKSATTPINVATGKLTSTWPTKAKTIRQIERGKNQ